MRQSQKVYELDDLKDRLHFLQKYYYLVPAEVPLAHEPDPLKWIQLSVPTLSSLGSP